MASLTLQFRNGTTLVQRMRDGQPCDEVVLWDGTRVTHPADREGLLEVLQEVWLEQVYTDGFYWPQDGDVIVDAGANIGLFSIYVARQNPRCRVVAVEPFAENFQYLQANIARACPKTVTCVEVALGSDFGRAQMQAVGTRSTDHVLRAERVGRDLRGSQFTAASAEPGDTSQSDGVRVIPLSGLFDLAGAEEISFLKVDIEGSERDVLSAASPDILGRFQRIAMEYHDAIVPGTLKLLRNVLEPTHDITVRPSTVEGYGILLAHTRDHRP